MTDGSQNSDFMIPTFSRGAWTDQPFPISWYKPASDHGESLENGGYNKFLTQTAHGDLTLTVWRWEGLGDEPNSCTPHPHGGALFLVDVETSAGLSTVAAMDVADMMDLLVRWAPALQTGPARR